MLIWYKFLVFNFDAYFNGENIYRSYLRSKQISEAPLLFGQGKLPAYSYGNPDLYIISKKNDSAMAVGLFNMFADCIYKPVIELDNAYKEINFVNCTGRIENDNDEKHIEYTGVSNKKILENIEWLKHSRKEFVFRVPMIPNITDTEENIRAIKEIAEDFPTEFLPYNEMAGAKYEMLGMEYKL